MAINICTKEELEKAESILFNWLKNELKPIKMSGYLSYMKQSYPSHHLHHIFGSYTGKKGCDLVVPLNIYEHAKAEEDKSGTTMLKYLPKAINYLMEYVATEHRKTE